MEDEDCLDYTINTVDQVFETEAIAYSSSVLGLFDETLIEDFDDEVDSLLSDWGL